MLRKTLCLLLVSLLTLPVPAQTTTPPTDADVLKGIALVDEGDYDGAIITLDKAARRLAESRKQPNDLSQAYLYLGIAYIGKGHEAAAKAKFREALGQIRDLTLSPDSFPPKVINAFEEAKQEASRSAPAQAAAASPAPPPAEKKGGSGKILLIVGGLAAAGGIAVAAGGGGGSDSGGSTSPTTTAPAQGRTQDPFGGSVGPQEQFGKTFVMAASGEAQVDVGWNSSDIRLDIGCQEEAPPYTGCGGTYTQLTGTTARYVARLSGPKTYLVLISNFSSRQSPEAFSGVITHP